MIDRFHLRRLALPLALLCAGQLGASEPAGRFAPTAASTGDYQPTKFDLSGIAPYKPEAEAIGTIRISGTPLDNLIGTWANDFKNFHKRARFTTYLTNTSQAMAGIVQGTADIGVMGHRTWLESRRAFREVHGHDPLEIRFAKGSYDDPKGSTPGLVFFVHKDNPLASLTIEQIDGIFGTQRTGGWHGTQWTTAAARGPEGNIRTWGQLGLKGEWADKPIALHGTDITLSNWADLIEQVAFKGGTKWNPALHEGPRADILEGNHDRQIVSAVGNDRYAVGFMFKRVVDAVGAPVRVLPIARDGLSAAIAPSNGSFFDGSYPFHNSVYLYLNKQPGKPLPVREREFARFILSREGQAIIAAERRFIPLNAAEIRAELAKLDQE